MARQQRVTARSGRSKPAKCLYRTGGPCGRRQVLIARRISMEKKKLDINNMNGMTEEEDKTCGLNDMNCLENEEDKTCGLNDMNCVEDEEDKTCGLNDMNCLGE